MANCAGRIRVRLRKPSKFPLPSSTEQARATAFAMPVLQQAERVTVLTVEGGTAVPGPTGEQLCRYLQAHGIPATASTAGLDGRSTGEVILSTASSLGCDLLIKGAYTQSRLRQMIFGGATRHILARATIPVLPPGGNGTTSVIGRLG